MGELTDEDTIASIQAAISDLRSQVSAMAESRPVYGADLVLAQRRLEDAWMRLDVALAIIRGEDPFAYMQPGD